MDPNTWDACMLTIPSHTTVRNGHVPCVLSDSSIFVLHLSFWEFVINEPLAKMKGFMVGLCYFWWRIRTSMHQYTCLHFSFQYLFHDMVVVCSSGHARWCCCWYSWFSYGTGCAWQMRQYKNDQLITFVLSSVHFIPWCSILVPCILLYDIMHPLFVDQISIKVFYQWQITKTRITQSM